MPDGTIMRYDDRFLPEKPGPGAAYAGLAGQGVGLLGGLGTLYAAKEMGLLGGAAEAGETAAASNLGTLGSGGLETFGSEMGSLGGTGAAETGFGSTFAAAAPYAALLGGGLLSYDAFKDQHGSRGKTALEGALGGGLLGGGGAALALGASNPAFWPIVAGSALAGGGMGGLLGGRKSTKDRERERWQSVGKDPVYKDYFEGTAGQQNRDESNLTAEAITETPDFYRVAGYQNFTPEQKKKAAQAMLDARALNEKQGGIYLNDAYAQQVIDAIKAGEEVPEYKDKAWY